ncbi:MAG: Maf family nucleotide pyrophosphatase [Bacteroidales bacterium]|jgi:septum formation protein|nr:Maf family nucleotide pyrophosphatase [Bacteroidales bacterium]
MFFKNLKNYKIVLASQSPRRQYLLKELGVEFDIYNKHIIDESFPDRLLREEIPLYLAEKKAQGFNDNLDDKTIVITADTIVWFDNSILEKPKEEKDAFDTLKKLSGNVHQVYTGVCLKSKTKQTAFYSKTDVYFKDLTDREIGYYIDKYEPFDKAGAYGIQEWIGYIGVEKIEGSFFNVMGLPVQKLYKELNAFIK